MPIKLSLPTSRPMPAQSVMFLRRIRHRITSTKVRQPILWWRHKGLKATDIMLGTYPRSGSTWLRFTLFEILTGKPSGFDTVNAAFRGLSDHKQGWPLLPGGGRFIGTHEPYHHSYRKALYLVRDVRDVALSEFAYEKGRGIGREHLDDYLNDLLLGRKRHGSWQDHVHSWLDSPLAATGNLLVIRYEDLMRDSVQIFMKIAEFLGVTVNRQRVETAVSNNSLTRMRQKEDQLYTQDNYSAVPRAPERDVKGNERFVRFGKVGGWQGAFTPAQLSMIEKYTRDALLRLGYSVESLSVDENRVMGSSAIPSAVGS